MLNHVRTIFSGGGGGVKCLLTAVVAVGLLLAAPAGTAEAQSVSFSATTGTVKEGPPLGAAPPPLTVTVTKSADVTGAVTLVSNPAFTSFGVGTAESSGLPGLRVWAVPALTGSSPTPTINFERNQAVLTFRQASEQPAAANWNDEKIILALRAPAGTRIGPDLTLTMDDLQAQPVITWSKTSIKLTEDSVASGVIRAASPASTTGKTPAILTSFTEKTATGRHRPRIKVTPANGIGTSATVAGDITLQIGSGPTAIGPGDGNLIAGMAGVFSLPMSVMEAASTNGVAFEVMANKDSDGFRNPMITLAFQDLEIKSGSAGAVVTNGILKAGPPLVVEVISDEAVPTVYFSPTDISIQEGGRTTAALVSEGKQGAEVNTVKLSVSGDALVDLWMGTKKLAPVDGKVTVSLAGTNLARLTARSTSDRSLLDGQMKKKTWRITDADGANIDADANSLTVTVEGSTAVPALPLVAQLLLALFLMASGARLYRRRHS